jgi:hypothetical protein
MMATFTSTLSPVLSPSSSSTEFTDATTLALTQRIIDKAVDSKILRVTKVTIHWKDGWARLGDRLIFAAQAGIGGPSVAWSPQPLNALIASPHPPHANNQFGICAAIDRQEPDPEGGISQRTSSETEPPLLTLQVTFDYDAVRAHPCREDLERFFVPGIAEYERERQELVARLPELWYLIEAGRHDLHGHFHTLMLIANGALSTGMSLFELRHFKRSLDQALAPVAIACEPLEAIQATIDWFDAMETGEGGGVLADYDEMDGLTGI